MRRGPRDTERPVVVLGEFDGFHLGHRHLVHGSSQLARRLARPLVAVVLADQSAADLLTNVDERCWALLASGASSALAVSLASPEDDGVGAQIVDEIVDRLDPATVVMACLPNDGTAARYPSLRAEFSRRGLDVVEVQRRSDPDGQFISSSRVRAALRAGEVARANDWLGRTFTLAGTVVHGSGLGRTIGFPTANLELAPNLLVPMNGVYAAVVDLEGGDQHRSAVNIGVRPTVEHDGKVLVEAHLLDFDGDLYGTRIQVGFRRWLRDEQRFASIDDLIAQLGVDVDDARLVLRG